MKKIALILSIAGLVVASYGQGYISFVNAAATDISTNNTQNIWGNSLTAVGNGSGLTTGSTANPFGFNYVLLMQTYAGGSTNNPTDSTLLSQGWSFTGSTATNALGSGRLAGGNPTQTTSADVVGDGNQFLIVGWSANVAGGGFSGWLTVSNELAAGPTASWSLLSGTLGYFGFSTIGTGTGQPNTSPEQLFGGSTGIQGPITLYAVPVPEPTTIALAGLGGLSMLLFRRRKV